jgi:hypothetical protein
MASELTFPLLSSGAMRVLQSPLKDNAIAMYPSTLASSFNTRVIKFLNDTEQRFLVNDKLFSCTLQYHGVNGYDMAILRAFFNAMDGMLIDPTLEHSFSITIDGSTYDYCGFGQDELDVEVGRGETFSFELKIIQVAPNSATGS